MDENLLGNVLGSLINKDNNGWGGNGGIWLIFLFFLFFMNGGIGHGSAATQADVSQGFNFNNLENEVRANGRSIADSAYQNLAQVQSVVNGISNLNQSLNTIAGDINRNVDNTRYDISQNANAINMGVMSNANAITKGLADVKYDMGQNFAGVGRAIDSVKYEDAQNACGINRNLDAIRADMNSHTCAITTNDTANTQRILDKLCQMENSNKDNIIASLRTDLQAAQLTLSNQNQTANIIGSLSPRPVPAYVVSSPYGTYSTGTTIA